MKYQMRTPGWLRMLDGDLLTRSLGSLPLQQLVHKAQREYLHWDTFRFQPLPVGFTAEEAWAAVKWARVGQYQVTPIQSMGKGAFRFALTNTMHQKLNYIDTHAFGFAKTWLENQPSHAQKNAYLMAGITEEAIATSQLEGANTSRKAAQEMIASQRAPRTLSEQMIVNSFRAMQRVDDLKQADLGLDMLLEIQSIITDKTLDDPAAQGRFRTDADRIVVSDPLTGDIVHAPPKAVVMQSELQRLVDFANAPADQDDFVHPVVKAAILHFWLAYLHPFVDGNGRTSRALFNWYLLKHDYWLVGYLSTSRAILQSRKKYDDAFVHTETDDDDLTYFILYIIDCLQSSLDVFAESFKKNELREQALEKTAAILDGYNVRQVGLLQSFLEHPGHAMTVRIYQSRYGVSRATANNDLVDLVEKGLLVRTARGRAYVFMPNIPLIKKLYQS